MADQNLSRAVNADDPSAFTTESRQVISPPDENTLRIMITTDNHLGFAEDDVYRREDSFRSFEECLRIAKDNQCDMVLLGGDFFHHNKPSRTTLLRATDLFREYCMGPKNVKIQLESDPKNHFADGMANYMDPSINVEMPVFAIHGNHDDPTGLPPVSALSILHAARLINYFGACAPNRVEVRPLELRKGRTRLAIYGLGHIRDDRLQREVEGGRALWQRAGVAPYEQDDESASTDDGYVHLGVVHQNRVRHGHGTGYLDCSLLPQWLHVVVWGHEHDSRPEAEPVDDRAVTQPGSTVATALSRGESLRKHCLIMDVRESKYRLVPVKLRSVRPFHFDEVVVRGDPVAVEQQLHERVRTAINAIAAQRKPNHRALMGRLHVSDAFLRRMSRLAEHGPLSVEAAASAQAGTTAAASAGAEQTMVVSHSVSGVRRVTELRDPYRLLDLPLVRLRVSGDVDALHAGRFGQTYVDQVANCDDILLVDRKRGLRAARMGSTYNAEAEEEEEEPEEEVVSILELLAEEVKKEGGLCVLGLNEMRRAVACYVDKTDLHAMDTYVRTRALEVEGIGSTALDGATASLEESFRDALGIRVVPAASTIASAAPVAEAPKRGRAAAGSKRKTAAEKAAEKAAAEALKAETKAERGEASEVSSEEEPPAKRGRGAATKSTRGRGRARGRGRGGASRERESDESDASESSDLEVVSVVSRPGRGRAAVKVKQEARPTAQESVGPGLSPLEMAHMPGHAHAHVHTHGHEESCSARSLYGAEGCYHDPLDPRNQGHFSPQEARALVQAARMRATLTEAVAMEEEDGEIEL